MCRGVLLVIADKELQRQEEMKIASGSMGEKENKSKKLSRVSTPNRNALYDSNLSNYILHCVNLDHHRECSLRDL